MSVEYIIGSNFTAINGGAWIDRMKHKTFLSYWLWPWTYTVCERTLWFSPSEHHGCLALSTIMKWVLIRGVPIAGFRLIYGHSIFLHSDYWWDRMKRWYAVWSPTSIKYSQQYWHLWNSIHKEQVKMSLCSVPIDIFLTSEQRYL